MQEIEASFYCHTVFLATNLVLACGYVQTIICEGGDVRFERHGHHLSTHQLRAEVRHALLDLGEKLQRAHKQKLQSAPGVPELAAWVKVIRACRDVLSGCIVKIILFDNAINRRTLQTSGPQWDRGSFAFQLPKHPSPAEMLGHLQA